MSSFNPAQYKGRKMITTDVDEITADNIQEVIGKAMSTHNNNVGQIKTLIEYEKGDQNIYARVKEVRPEINNKVVENHAHEITAFKVSYSFANPVSYVQRAMTDNTTPSNDNTLIDTVNKMLFEEGKQAKDQALAYDFMTCGVGYRLILPYQNKTGFSDFQLLKLDPKSTFIVYSADVFHNPMAGVTYWEDENAIKHYTVYTNTKVFEAVGLLQESAFALTQAIVESVNGIGVIPIIEYDNDYQRMGCFERVIGLLDSINLATSDRLNGLDQFIQALLWFNNVDIDKEQYDEMRDAGVVLTSSKAGVDGKLQYINIPLNQTEVQSLADALYAQVLTVTGVPARGSTGGGNTGVALMLGESGWQLAEERAQMSEAIFKESEYKTLNVIKHILANANNSITDELNLADIDIKFNRNKISNLSTKTSSLSTLLKSGIHPLHAIQTCDIFSDPQQVYTDSEPYLGKALGITIDEDGNVTVNQPTVDTTADSTNSDTSGDNTNATQQKANV